MEPGGESRGDGTGWDVDGTGGNGMGASPRGLREGPGREMAMRKPPERGGSAPTSFPAGTGGGLLARKVARALVRQRSLAAENSGGGRGRTWGAPNLCGARRSAGFVVAALPGSLSPSRGGERAWGCGCECSM